MGREEQREERDVLGSIFPDEITDISDYSYSIAIAIDVSDPSVEAGDDVPLPSVLLTVSCPEDYPAVAPNLSLSNSPRDNTKPSYLSLPEDAEQLLDSLGESITDSLGSPMIFTVTSVLKENIESLILGRQTEVQDAKDSEARQAEEAENVKFHGEKVTRERFLEWRKGFLQEMADKEDEEKIKIEEEAGKGRKAKVEDIKLSGRQLWERGLAGKVEDEELDYHDDGSAAQQEDIAKGMESASIRS